MKLLALLSVLPLALAAPILEARDTTIPGEFIVVMKPESTVNTLRNNMQTVARILSGTAKPRQSFELGDFKGFHVSASDSLIKKIANLADIAYIEPDAKVSINALTTQTDAPWGLARISQSKLQSMDYVYDESAGEGTYAYIIDTGIDIHHPDFEGRATFGASFVSNEVDTDRNGHGTHVAGTTGSVTYGVAKKTNLIAVKVMDADGSGKLSQIIAGIEWAVDDAKSQGRIDKAVANVSLGSFRLLSRSVNAAAAAAVKAGLFVAAAAGNNGIPASLTSPASESSVCTVAATQPNDRRALFSNWGSAVDVFAPGVNITSTWIHDSSRMMSGTSMASPHVAGLGAYLLGLEGPRDPLVLCKKIQSMATKHVVGVSLSKNNLLAFNGAT